ncbi:MAG: ClpXP protease specificity-enhancing factor [Legionella sp.]|uniref:ClpXP protease specificity-enhancing factor n=1 Tax=Legionella sp. TaxID=459 RepID=UPI0039E4EE52
MNMTSIKPYLIRSAYDWIVDNGLTPYILVSTDYFGVQVPKEHVVEGRIVLNISPAATRGLLLENDRIDFAARFSGKTEQISIPPGAVLEIYAKENGRGIPFEIEESPPPPPPAATVDVKSLAGKGSKPSLKLVEK